MVVNPAPVPAGSRASRLTAVADVVVANAVEARALGLGDRAGLGGLPEPVTLGVGGARVGGTHVPAFPARAVDATGAGDVLTGALAVAAEGGEPGRGVPLRAARAPAPSRPWAEPSFPAARRSRRGCACRPEPTVVATGC